MEVAVVVIGDAHKLTLVLTYCAINSLWQVWSPTAYIMIVLRNIAVLIKLKSSTVSAEISPGGTKAADLFVFWFFFSFLLFHFWVISLPRFLWYVRLFFFLHLLDCLNTNRDFGACSSLLGSSSFSFNHLKRVIVFVSHDCIMSLASHHVGLGVDQPGCPKACCSPPHRT